MSDQSKFIPKKEGTPPKRSFMAKPYRYSSLDWTSMDEPLSFSASSTPQPTPAPTPKKWDTPLEHRVVRVKSLEFTNNSTPVNSQYRRYWVVGMHGYVSYYTGPDRVTLYFIGNSFEFSQTVHPGDLEAVEGVSLPDPNAWYQVVKQLNNGFEKEIVRQQEALADEVMNRVVERVASQARPLGEQNFFSLDVALNTNDCFGWAGITVPRKGFIAYQNISQLGLWDTIASEAHDTIELLLPKQWVELRGYDEAAVRAWVQFLNEAGFDTDCRLVDCAPSKELYTIPSKTHVLHAIAKGLGTAEEMLNAFNTILTDLQAYRVQVRLGDYKDVNFYVCQLVLSLYQRHLSKLPGLTLQLHEALAGSLSRWQALLCVLCTDLRKYLSNNSFGSVRCLVVNPFAADNTLETLFAAVENNPSPGQWANLFSHCSLETTEHKQLINLLSTKNFETFYQQFKTFVK